MTSTQTEPQQPAALPMDEFAAAARLLGSREAIGDGPANIEARLAAMHALAFLTRRHTALLPLVVETLCSYLRLNAGWADGAPPTREAAAIPHDVQQAAELVALRCGVRRPQRCHVDLTRVDLRGARLWGSDFRGAVLGRTLFDFADLGQSDFAGAQLPGASLQGAIVIESDFRKANLWGARFCRANIAGIRLDEAELALTDFTDAKPRDFAP